LSRQRLRPSLLETNFEKCTHCSGMGLVRSTESTALSVLRGLEQEGIKSRAGDYLVKLPAKVALYILNYKRTTLMDIQQRYGVVAQFDDNTSNVAGEFTIERLKSRSLRDQGDAPAVNLDEIMAGDMARPDIAAPSAEEGQRRERGDRNERFQRRPNNRPPRPQRDFLPPPVRATDATAGNDEPVSDELDKPNNGQNGMVRAESDQRPRRRGRRGGRRRGRNDGERVDQSHDNQNNSTATPEFSAESSPSTMISAQIQAPPRIEIPRSIHELDTTPRADDAPRSFAPYEINQAPDKPKAGWWRRLTGQE
jgi:ribonuclease E